MIVVLNAGGQYCHLIARRVRALGARSEVLPFETPAGKLRQLAPDAIVLSGGPASVYASGAPRADDAIFSLGIPVLGICYGHQYLARAVGGTVQRANVAEFGRRTLRLLPSSLFQGVTGKQRVWMSHGDEVAGLPRGFKRIAAGAAGGFLAFADVKRKLYGVQFHPEVVHTPAGTQILRNFLFRISRAKRDWSLGGERTKIVSELRQTIGKKRVLMAVSGGVDSTVAAALLHETVGDRLHCVFVDSGLLREGEAAEVRALFEKKLRFRNFHFVDASEQFLSALDGVGDPEEKRKRIGHLFIRVFEAKAEALKKKFPGMEFLGQGTIYPDRIESAQPSKNAAKIKSHHNLTLPQDLKLKIVEPLNEFYKDDVRKLGAQLGLPREWLGRHPFPGPGLAIRVVGAFSREKLALARAADAIFIQTLRKHKQYDNVWQAYAAVLPVKSVGVQGDARTYAYAVALRAVTSVDGMTADWARLPPDVLEAASTEITNRVRGINRVVYDVTQKPPGTIEYE